MYLQWTRVSFILIRFDKLPVMILIQIFPFVIFHFYFVVFVGRTFNLQSHWEKSLREQNTRNESIKLPETRTISTRVKFFLLRTSFFLRIYICITLSIWEPQGKDTTSHIFFSFSYMRAILKFSSSRTSRTSPKPSFCRFSRASPEEHSRQKYWFMYRMFHNKRSIFKWRIQHLKSTKSFVHNVRPIWSPSPDIASFQCYHLLSDY